MKWTPAWSSQEETDYLRGLNILKLVTGHVTVTKEVLRLEVDISTNIQAFSIPKLKPREDTPYDLTIRKRSAPSQWYSLKWTPWA